MTAPDGLDFAFGRPNPAVLFGQGIRVVSRYISPPPNSKNLTAAEAAADHAAGLGIIINWESAGNRALGGGVNGTYDGSAAVVYCESIGVPHGTTIYFSVDVDTNSSQYPTILAYFRAVQAAVGSRYLIGAYGEADLIDFLHNAGVITSEWQTYAWSNGRLSANADFYQYANGQTMAGAAVDYDRIIHIAQLGAWWPAGVSPSGGGTEIDVPLTPADGTLVWGTPVPPTAPNFPNAAPWELLADTAARTITLTNQVAAIQNILATLPAPTPAIDPAALAASVAVSVLAGLPAATGLSLADITNAFKNALESASIVTVDTSSSKIQVAI